MTYRYGFYEIQGINSLAKTIWLVPSISTFTIVGTFLKEWTVNWMFPLTKMTPMCMLVVLVCICHWRYSRPKTFDFATWNHDDVIKWKNFSRYWPFVRGIHRSSLNSPHKGQWCGAWMFYLIYSRINGRVNSGEAGDLRQLRAYYDVSVMIIRKLKMPNSQICVQL